MGRWKGIIPIVLALVVALIASFFLYRWTKKRVGPEVAKEEEVKVVKVADCFINYIRVIFFVSFAVNINLSFCN